MKFDLINTFIEGLFQREKKLSNSGLSSFVPKLRFVESFAETQDEIQEYRQLAIDISKSRIIRDKNIQEKLQYLQNECKSRARSSGNSWDYAMSSLDRRIEKLRRTDEEKFWDIYKPYLEHAENLWLDEVRLFSYGYFEHLFMKQKAELSRKAHYKKMMGKKLEEFGFKYNSELSSGGFIYHAKPLTKSYTLCWVLDASLIQKSVSFSPLYAVIRSSGQKREIKIAGYQFEVFLLLRATEDKVKNARLLSFSLDDLFPIGKHYRNFRDLKELEALVNIYALMYSLIKSDLEAALKALVNESLL